MNVTISGSKDQVLDALGVVPTNRRARRGDSALARHQARMRHRRALLSRAFGAVRNDPGQQALAWELARALGGSRPMTDALVATAKDLLSGLATAGSEGGSRG